MRRARCGPACRGRFSRCLGEASAGSGAGCRTQHAHGPACKAYFSWLPLAMGRGRRLLKRHGQLGRRNRRLKLTRKGQCGRVHTTKHECLPPSPWRVLGPACRGRKRQRRRGGQLRGGRLPGTACCRLAHARARGAPACHPRRVGVCALAGGAGAAAGAQAPAARRVLQLLHPQGTLLLLLLSPAHHAQRHVQRTCTLHAPARTATTSPRYTMSLLSPDHHHQATHIISNALLHT